MAHELGISDQTIYNSRRQDRIDRGIQPGLSSAGMRRWPKARKLIAELLQTRLEISRRATENYFWTSFKGGSPQLLYKTETGHDLASDNYDSFGNRCSSAAPRWPTRTRHTSITPTPSPGYDHRTRQRPRCARLTR